MINLNKTFPKVEKSKPFCLVAGSRIDVFLLGSHQRERLFLLEQRMEKRYYWLKLKDDFFEEKHIRALRKLPDGDQLVIVYLKMQLKSLKTEGILKFEKIMPSKEEELALFLDEDINIIKLTLKALENMGTIEIWDDETIYLNLLQHLIGSETQVAERVRKHREKKKLLQSNILVTDGNTCNTEKREEKKEKIKEIDKDALFYTKIFYDDLMTYNNLTRYKNNKPNLNKWSEELKILNKVIDYDTMHKVWIWAMKDNFWKSNILSTKKFREKFDTLKLQMENKNDKPKTSVGAIPKGIKEKANQSISES
jgi:predicted phage replisome organizer